jgi:RNA polymerase sigma factor (TIGR02999 family)
MRRSPSFLPCRGTSRAGADDARASAAGKRGGDVRRVELDEARQVAANDADARLLHIDEALRDLAASNARHAQIIEMVYFGGLERVEVAAALGLSDTTVDRDLRLARAWLKTALAS